MLLPPAPRVLLAYNHAVLAQEEEEYYATQTEFKGQTLLLIQEALKETGCEVILFDVEQPLEDVIAALSSRDVHFVFNVTTCVSSVYSQALLPLLLDALGIPYLGSRAVVHSLCLDRSLTKLVLRGLGIPTPSFFLWSPQDPWPENLEFPLLVKPRFREHRGKKLSGFLIQDASSLQESALRIFEATEEKVIIEKYVTGKELVVGLWGNDREVECLPVVEVAPSFQGEFPRKGERVLGVADLPEEILVSVQRMAHKAFQELNMRDYATFRLILSEKENMPLFLEIHALPLLYYRQSPFPEMCAALDIDYTGMIQRLFHIAMKRVKLCA
ncbi:MAG: hypothetical protein ABDK93_00110 [Atribacterota bacterium]